MISIFATWVLPIIFILGAAVTLHEFGHFIVAKLLKIRVETFSFGFGPRLFGRKWGTTDYRVSAFPLGGYVKLGGDESNAPIEGEGAPDIAPAERFDLRPRWQRILVALAGPAMNVVTALSIPFAGALIYGVPAMPAPIVSYVRHGGSAEAAGLKPGDRIVSFDGEENPTWSDIDGKSILRPDQSVAMVVERSGQRVPLTIKISKRTENGNDRGELDFQPDPGALPVIVREVISGTPAESAGLQPGDQILELDGQVVRNRAQVTQYVQDHKDTGVRLTVLRGNRRLDLTATPRAEDSGVPKLGVYFAPEPLEHAGPIKAGNYAVGQNLWILKVTADALGQVLKGQRSMRDTLSGPIGIYNESRHVAQDYGWGGIMSLLAGLSLNLGMVNLLPIPVLDGGAIFLLLVEGGLALGGLTLSMKVRERIQQVGFVLIILLMVFAITNDLWKQASIWRGSGNNPAAPTK